MHPKSTPHGTIVAVVIALIVLSSFFSAQAASLQLTITGEYNQYVHTSVGVDWNVSVVDKPVFPVLINSSQIGIGANWTVCCPLQLGHSYHLYCFGSWVNTSSSAKTDYDLYVFDPAGGLVSSHTEAAGFPESVGSDASPFFVPAQSGNYSFMIKNSVADSKGCQQATFMIVESLACNTWHTSALEGYDGNRTRLHTAWTYEFATNNSKLQVFLKVPAGLDMYEARLYLMDDKNPVYVNSYPLPWEPGLYGNVSGSVGGYNFEPDGYRGVSYDSCEYMGQDMFLNYTAPAAYKGMKLYMLVLIGEEGAGDVEFMMKTNFDNATLTAVNSTGKVLPQAPAKISYRTDGSSLVAANVSFSCDSWNTTDFIPMDIDNATCNATIPGQKAGTTIQYRIDALDLLNNLLSTTGNYTVKAQPKLNITLTKDTVFTTENVTVSGFISPNDKNSVVSLQVFSANSSQTIECKVRGDGTFNASFNLATEGKYSISATAPETKTSWRCDSSQLPITVKEPPFYVKYQLYIVIGLIAALAAGGAVYYLKFMRK